MQKRLLKSKMPFESAFYTENDYSNAKNRLSQRFVWKTTTQIENAV